MRLLLLACLSQVRLAASLDCFSCGVFLSAPEPQCRGVARNNSCEPHNLGCLAIVGKNSDDTYYVEKRCAEKSDDLKEGCIDIGIRGIAAKQCLCKSDLCNGSSAFPAAAFLIGSLFLLFIDRVRLLH